MAEAVPDARDRYVTGYRLAWAKGDYQSAAAFVDSVKQSPQPGFQALARFQGAALNTLAGRLAEAERGIAEGIGMNLRRGAAAAVYNSGLARLDSWVRGQPQRAMRYMDSVLARHPLDSIAVLSRPYLQLAAFYAQAGNTGRAEQLIREYERLVPTEVQAGDDDRYAANGMLALAQGKPAEAVVAFRTYRERSRWCASCYLFETGLAFDALQQPDSALAAYQALATTVQPGPEGRELTLPLSYRRLGELYETRGDREKALESYGRFVDLWRNADPELQPKVKDVQKRIGELAGEKR
jgi:tetratricopeptide (TPR) repeat protein